MEGFIFYASFLEAIKELPNDSQLRLYQAITNFALNQIEPDNLQSIERAVFAVIKPQLIANQKRYENGKKGGRPKKETTDIKEEKPKEKEIKTNGYENKKPMVIETENLKRKIKKEKENKIENKKEIEIKKENSLAVIKANRTPQQEIYDYFSAKYKQLTGIDYKPDGKDFILIAKLLKNYEFDIIKTKIDWLEVGCKKSIFWFAKNINDFTIATLSAQWNRIFPQLTEEQKKQLEKKRKEEEMRKRIIAGLEAEEQIRRQANVGNIGRV